MKLILMICYLLLSTPGGYGQKSYCDTFGSSATVGLSLDSDNKFCLFSTSAEAMYDPEDLPDFASPPVIWLEGGYTKQGEKIVCKNCNGNGTFQLLKQQNRDCLMMTDAFWLKEGALLKSENIYDGKKAFSATLLTLLPRYIKFYIRSKEMTDNQQRKTIKLYMWENGKKNLFIKVVNEAGLIYA